MTTLVIGGAASGKSRYAESLVLASSAPLRIYVATMQPFDGECRLRIERHRRMRAHKQFITEERYTDLAGLRVPPGSAVLLECLSNLTANELYSPGGAGNGALEAVACGVQSLARQCRDLVVVTNEVFCGGKDYQGDTLRYLRVLALANRSIAGWADNVCEVLCGLPHYLKGKEPCD